MINPVFDQSRQDMTLVDPRTATASANREMQAGVGQLFQAPQGMGIAELLASEITNLQGEIGKAQGRRTELRDQLRQRVAARAAIRLQRVMPQQADPKDMAIAGLIALAGQFAGARNANQAFGQFVAGDQAIRQQQFQQAQAQAEQDFLQRDRAAQMGIQGVQMDIQGLDEDLADLLRRQSGAVSGAVRLEEQAQMTNRAAQANQRMLSIAEMRDRTDRFEATLNADVRRELGDKTGMIYRALIRAGVSEEDARAAIMAEYNERMARTDLTRERTATEKELRPIKVKQEEARVRLIQAQTSHTQALERFLPQRLDKERARIEQGWITAAQRGQEFSQDDIRQQERFIRDDISEANKQLAGLRKERREAMQAVSLWPEGSPERKSAMDAVAAIDAEIKGLQEVVNQANARLKELRTPRPANLIGPVDPNAPLNPMQADPSLRGRIGR